MLQPRTGVCRPRFSFGVIDINLAQELERQLATKRDLVVPSSLLQCRTDEGGDLKMIIDTNGCDGVYGITNLARRQLADKLKIPFTYFERMRTEQPSLLDRNVNTWLQIDNESRMIRTLDGQVRAVLSDRYRRLDNFDLARCRSCSGLTEHASSLSS